MKNIGNHEIELEQDVTLDLSGNISAAEEGELDPDSQNASPDESIQQSDSNSQEAVTEEQQDVSDSGAQEKSKKGKKKPGKLEIDPDELPAVNTLSGKEFQGLMKKLAQEGNSYMLAGLAWATIREKGLWRLDENCRKFSQFYRNEGKQASEVSHLIANSRVMKAIKVQLKLKNAPPVNHATELLKGRPEGVERFDVDLGPLLEVYCDLYANEEKVTAKVIRDALKEKGMIPEKTVKSEDTTEEESTSVPSDLVDRLTKARSLSESLVDQVQADLNEKARDLFDLIEGLVQDLESGSS